MILVFAPDWNKLKTVNKNSKLKLVSLIEMRTEISYDGITDEWNLSDLSMSNVSPQREVELG